MNSDCIGQIVDGRFRLQQYLSGTSERAVFRTEFAGAKAIIKLVFPGSSNPDAQLASWRRAAQLSHPHLIRIYQCGRCWFAGRDLLYVVAEYADENLAEVLPHRALTVAETESLLRPTLDALSYLHDQGLVHGHLRPGNVMAVDEELKISSDGVKPSGTVRERRELTGYDAPEIALGQLAPPADIWSLGITLIEALTQRSAREITREPAAYAQLPQPYADIAANCLKRDAAERWTVSDIAARLERPAATEVRPAVTDVSSTDLTAGEEKRSYAAPLIIAALLAVLGIGYGLMHRSSRSLEPRGVESSSPAASPPATNSVAQPDAPGAVAEQVLPKASQGALNTIHGRIKVRVKVDVDAAGAVRTASLITPGPSKYFARLAVEAAQEWKFSPPSKDGRAQPSQWTLLFEYAKGGMAASSEINASSRPN
ncbi:MAG: TonB family protein [Acidobacteria bacterium]|nr:TonB family protein [Acidobacteriota bacterium]